MQTKKYATLLLNNSAYFSFEVYFDVQLLNSPWKIMNYFLKTLMLQNSQVWLRSRRNIFLIF